MLLSLSLSCFSDGSYKDRAAAGGSAGRFCMEAHRDDRNGHQYVSCGPYGCRRLFPEKILVIKSVRGSRSYLAPNSFFAKALPVIFIMQCLPDIRGTYLPAFKSGNRKKAFLITAFALKPRLLLLDEPVNKVSFSLHCTTHSDF